MNSYIPPAWTAQFAGQSTPWRTESAELVPDPVIAARLGVTRDAAEKVLTPVAPELLTVTGLMDLPRAPLEAPENTGIAVPGILLAQYRVYLDAQEALSEPVATIGHSQGILGMAMLHNDHAQVLALARLIDIIAARGTLLAGASRRDEHTPMVPVKGENLTHVGLPGDVALAIKNSATPEVLSGVPKIFGAALKALKVEGECLDVAVSFHNPVLTPAMEQILQWARACGVSPLDATDLARAVFTESLDWAVKLHEKAPAGATVVDLGPRIGLARLVAEDFAGTGVHHIKVSATESRDALAQGIPRETASQDWSVFALAARVTDGRKVVETAFTRPASRSPIPVGGMTPTIVRPEVVAAMVSTGR